VGFGDEVTVTAVVALVIVSTTAGDVLAGNIELPL
jgi:hypothetical protein